MKTREELIYALRAVAEFYEKSPNMSDELMHIWRGAEASELVTLSVDDFYRIAVYLEAVR